MKIAGWTLLALGFLGFIISTIQFSGIMSFLFSAAPPSGASPAALADAVLISVRCAWGSVCLQGLGGLCLLVPRLLHSRPGAGFPVVLPDHPR